MKTTGGGEAQGDCSRPKYRKREAEQVGIPSCSRTMDPLMPNLKTERKSDGKTRRSHPPLSDPGLHIFRLCARFFAYRHRESERERVTANHSATTFPSRVLSLFDSTELSISEPCLFLPSPGSPVSVRFRGQGLDFSTDFLSTAVY